jgi:hypothetical protein
MAMNGSTGRRLTETMPRPLLVLERDQWRREWGLLHAQRGMVIEETDSALLSSTCDRSLWHW